MCTYRCANPVVLYVSGGNTQVIANSNSIYTILFYIYFIYIQPYVVIQCFHHYNSIQYIYNTIMYLYDYYVTTPRLLPIPTGGTASSARLLIQLLATAWVCIYIHIYMSMFTMYQYVDMCIRLILVLYTTTALRVYINIVYHYLSLISPYFPLILDRFARVLGLSNDPSPGYNIEQLALKGN